VPPWQAWPAWIGAALFWARLRRPRVKAASGASTPPFPKASILIPARNEAANLPRLLESLQRLDYPDREVIVVDDQSSDGTAEVAARFGARVIQGQPLPPGWNGKNWACHQAAQAATGDYLLFTDADTEHAPDSLKRAISFFESRKLNLLSAIPWHRAEKFWERLMGPFQALIFVATAPYSPKRHRLFAVGQYLLFSRSSYQGQGGHAAVAGEYPDDFALANSCFEHGGRYAVYNGPTLLKVRMYTNLASFITGYRRNFLAGIQITRWHSTVAVVLALWAMTGGGHPFQTLGSFLTALFCALLVARHQRAWGDFSVAGVIFLPFSLSVYALSTALAAFDFATGNAVRWKGRRYEDWKKPAPSEAAHDAS